MADELWARGVIEYVEGSRKGVPAQGLRAFDASLKAAPEFADRQFFAATMHSLSGHRAEAEKGYEAAIAIAPDRKPAYLELVMMLEAAGRRDAALEVARRAISNGAFWADPWQRPPLFDGRLASHAWWDRRHFPWADSLEAAYPTIKAELDALLLAKGSRKGRGMPGAWTKVGDGRSAHACDSEIVAPGGDWREFILFGCEEEPNVDVKRHLPKTLRLLEELLPSAVQMAKLGAGEIIFSALAPGTRLAPHCASSNVRLTCHLGMVCPPGARMRVGSQWGEWQEGKCVFFDDSFEHEIVHSGTSMRVVLLIRFWHPDLPESGRLPALDEGLEQNEQMNQRRSVPPVTDNVLRLAEERMPDIRSLFPTG